MLKIFLYESYLWHHCRQKVYTHLQHFLNELSSHEAKVVAPPLNKFYEKIAVFTQKTQAKHLPAWSSFRSWISISEKPPLRSLSKSRQYREHKIPRFHQYCQLAGLDFLSSPPFGVTAILRHLSSLRNDRKSALCIPVLQPSFWIAAGNCCTECHNGLDLVLRK